MDQESCQSKLLIQQVSGLCKADYLQVNNSRSAENACVKVGYTLDFSRGSRAGYV